MIVQITVTAVWCWPRSLEKCVCLAMVRPHKRQREPKGRPRTRRAFDPDATALRFHQALSHRQAQPRAALAPGSRAVRAPKMLKDVRQVLWRDALARIGNGNLYNRVSSYRRAISVFSSG